MSLRHDSIDLDAFNETLARYPDLILEVSDSKQKRRSTGTDADETLASLDTWRLKDLPKTLAACRQSKREDDYLQKAEVEKLIRWKLLVFFPSSGFRWSPEVVRSERRELMNPSSQETRYIPTKSHETSLIQQRRCHQGHHHPCLRRRQLALSKIRNRYGWNHGSPFNPHLAPRHRPCLRLAPSVGPIPPIRPVLLG